MQYTQYTGSVNKAIKGAGKMALKSGAYEIGTEHLLYGLSSVTESVASKLLATFGVTPNALESAILKNTNRTGNFVIQAEVGFTPRVKEVFQLAHQFSAQIGHNFIGTEHLLVSLLLSEDSMAVTLLKKVFRINVNDLKNSVLQVVKATGMDSANSGYNYKPSTAQFREQREEESPFVSAAPQSGSPLPPSLLQMGQDLTLKAKQNKIDPVIGRSDEIARVIEILCRKTKNNPVLIGEAGVGKSAIVDGLARAIVNGDVPELLKGKTIFSLEIGGLMAGTKYRGAMEEKLKELIEVIKNNKDIIVFIDELHTLMQAGGDKGEVNPSDMLKPYLARGEFQTIGATTTDEYKKFIEKDSALERRFQPITVNPPSVEDTIKILMGLRDSFEAFHKVKISDDAITTAATYSDKYITDRNLPDKAIDLIDEASSRAKVKGNAKPEAICKLDEQLAKLDGEKREALLTDNFEKAAQLRDKIRTVQEEKKELEKKTMAAGGITITGQEICDIISKWTGIPVTKITESERERLLNLEEVLHKRVMGQEEAVTAVAKAIRRSRIGLKDNNRPIGSFLFIGPTGVGKTELCKALAEAMFDSESRVIRLDMSEYMEKHSVSKLIGSPPGYVGYDEGGQLTEAVRRKPYSVVLFDEVEKAHPDVFNLLLQILDDGRLTDSQGRTVLFKNTIIILTSNIGVNALPKQTKKFGFSAEETRELAFEEVKEILMNELRRAFRPEFLNRLDNITVFKPLSFQQIEEIARKFIGDLNKRLKTQGYGLQVSMSVLRYLIEKGYNAEYGARPLRRLIEQEIEDRIAEGMLQGGIANGDTIIVSFDNETGIQISTQK